MDLREKKVLHFPRYLFHKLLGSTSLCLFISVQSSLSVKADLAYAERNLYISQDVKENEWSKLQKHKIEYVTVYNGGDVRIFDSALKTRNLRSVSIELDVSKTPEVNIDGDWEFTQCKSVRYPNDSRQLQKLLNDLFQNCPELPELKIHKSQPFSDEELQNIYRFKNLSSLWLGADLEKGLSLHLPSTLTSMTFEKFNFAEQVKGLSLPKMREMYIISCGTPSNLLKQNDFPLLKTLKLQGIQLDPDFWNSLKKFPRLNEITLLETPATVEDLAQWSAPLHVTFYGNYKIHAVKSKTASVSHQK